MTTQIRAISLFALMVAASAIAFALVPSKRLSDENPVGNLAETIPEQFGSWKVDPVNSKFIVNPTLQASLWGIYSQSVSRTYTHSSGYRVMLSVAYGGDQSRALQVHRPEVCYSAGGFSIEAMNKAVLETPIGPIPVMHVIAQQDARHEPITYWVRIGEKIVRGNLEQGFARLSYGLRGYTADGLLFRVSSIDPDAGHAYEMQSLFVRELATAIPPDKRPSLFGKP